MWYDRQTRWSSPVQGCVTWDENPSLGSSMPAPRQYKPWVPPRRLTTYLMERVAKDKKRLQELKMDNGFERIKIKNIAP